METLAKKLDTEISYKAVEISWCHQSKKTIVTEQNVIQVPEYFIITTLGH